MIVFDSTSTESLASTERVILQSDVGSVSLKVKNTNICSHLCSLVITLVNIHPTQINLLSSVKTFYSKHPLEMQVK